MKKVQIFIFCLVFLIAFWYKQHTSIAYSVSSINNLTPEELKLYSEYPFETIRARDAAHVAEEYAAQHYSWYTLSEGNGDACRHALWSALMTKRISRDFAYKAGLAHEGLEKGYNFDYQDDSCKMDISNNYSGRILATTYSDYTEDKLKRLVVTEVNACRLKRIRVYASGSGENIKTKYVGYYVPTSSGGNYNPVKPVYTTK